MNTGVFIAMPVYRGTEVIEETLRSILAQTHDDFHLVMSVDGADDPTIETCRKYENDPRIDVVVQETHLGWPGNFNWLVDNCDREFFCYWQQDDLASTGYLDSLQRELLARPDASIAYTDVQWFGGRFDREGTPSIEGDPLSRVMQHIEAIRYQPLRGLMRKTMLPQGVAAIPVTEDESCQEEFVFLAHMAAAGAFIRIDSAMYFKRLHDSNAFVRWAHFPDWRRRRGWISMGSGMYRIARGLATDEQRAHVLTQIVDRLAVERQGRAHFYVPTQNAKEIQRFVRDFASLAELTARDLGPHGARPSPMERPVHEDVLAGIQMERDALVDRKSMAGRLAHDEALTIEMRDAASGSLLGFGWSDLESWGAWTDGGHAELKVPAPNGRAWRATLVGEGYGTSEIIRVGYGIAGGHFDYVHTRPGHKVKLVVESESTHDVVVQLKLPDASSPKADGLSADTRLLGFGLQRFDIELLDLED